MEEELARNVKNIKASVFLQLLFLFANALIQTVNGSQQLTTESSAGQTEVSEKNRLFLSVTTLLAGPFLYDIMDLDNSSKRIGYIQVWHLI